MCRRTKQLLGYLHCHNLEKIIRVKTTKKLITKFPAPNQNDVNPLRTVRGIDAATHDYASRRADSDARPNVHQLLKKGQTGGVVVVVSSDRRRTPLRTSCLLETGVRANVIK